MSRFRSHTGLILGSIVVALLLGLLPLPDSLQALRPYWLAIVLAYWALEAPSRVGLGFAFLTGLIADVMFAGLLGEQALRLVILVFILQRFRARLRFFPLWQQALAIGGLLLNDRVIALIISLIVGDRVFQHGYWWVALLGSPVLGLLLWTPLFLFMDALRLGRRNKA